jgi:peptide/nickel transport system substrate-binding protein/microcin C transport system substrate-binding protein
MIIDRFEQSLSPGAEQTYMWGSQAADEKGNQNSAGIKNKAIDVVIAKLIVSKNRDDIVLYSKVLDRLLRAGYYVVPTYGKHTDNVAYWKFYEHGPLPSNAIGIDYWWANKDKQAQVMQYLGK